MKPYILNYSYHVKKKNLKFFYDDRSQINIFKDGSNAIDQCKVDITRITENLEPTDPDEFALEPTIQTFSVEPSDPDEFLF